MNRFNNSEMKDIIVEYWFGMKKLLEKKILENLTVSFSFDDTSKQIFTPL